MLQRMALGGVAAAALVVLVAVFGGTHAAFAAGSYTAGAAGYDISWPQCGGAYPATPFGFGIVGVADGRANTQNPCLASEYAWAQQGMAAAPSVYLNLNYGTIRGSCARHDLVCQAYNYGYGAAQNARSYAAGQSVVASVWWLDVETGNTWSKTTSLNAEVIKGASDFLHAQGMTVGVYSTPYQWGVIAGSYSPELPNWTAGAPSSDPASYCDASHAFGGGTVWLAQYANGNFDGDYAC
jgi:hypothetical protein